MSARHATTGPGVPAYVDADLIHAQRPKPLGDDAGGSLLTIRELRVHVELAAKLQSAVAQGVGGTTNALLARLAGKGHGK
jgi:hypothetical protein